MCKQPYATLKMDYKTLLIFGVLQGLGFIGAELSEYGCVVFSFMCIPGYRPQKQLEIQLVNHRQLLILPMSRILICQSVDHYTKVHLSLNEPFGH